MLRTGHSLLALLLWLCSLTWVTALMSYQAHAGTPSKRPAAQQAATSTAQAQRQATRPARPVAAQQRASSVRSTASKRPVAAAPQRRSEGQVAQRRTQRVAAASTAAAALAAAAVVSEGERLGLRRVPDPLDLNSSVALVLDADTNEILLGKNDTAVLPIASLTKLMTGILIADSSLPMDETITISSADVDRLRNSGSRLAVGARLTREQALHLALMSSENRATHALARTFPGGEQEFVRLMNRKAAELGMTDTRFADPTGLSSQNRSSARDVAILVAASYERPMLRAFSTSRSYDLRVRGNVLSYRNSNRLVNSDAWDIDLQKTGFIQEAGRSVTMKVNMAGRRLIMVLLDASSKNARLADAERLRRWLQQDSLLSKARHRVELSGQT